MRRGTQGHVAEPCEPTQRSGGARWRERVADATRVHADARVAPRGTKGPGRWRAHRLVDLGNSIGAVTHLRITTPPYIHDTSLYFIRVGLCSCGISPLPVTWQHGGRRM